MLSSKQIWFRIAFIRPNVDFLSDQDKDAFADLCIRTVIKAKESSRLLRAMPASELDIPEQTYGFMSDEDQKTLDEIYQKLSRRINAG